MIFIEPNSVFSARVNFSLSLTDCDVLSSLYLPIIKSDAFALYHVLISISRFQFEYVSHDDIFNLLGYNESRFLDAKKNLEAIGLVETYRKKETSKDERIFYIYKILPPATPQKFFADVLYRNLLVSIIGKKKFFDLFNHFKIANTFTDDTFINLSAQFKDVFLSQITDEESINPDDISHILNKEYKSQQTFSFNELKDKLSSINYQFKLNENTVKKVIDTCVLYNVDLDSATKLILENTNLDGKFYIDKFIDASRTLHVYRPINNSSEKEIVGDSKTVQLIQIFTTITPQSLLQMKLNVNKLPSFMYEDIYKLKNDLQLSN